MVKEFPTREINFLAFKLATAHQAGYVEFGTFKFRLSAVQDLFPPEFMEACLRGISDKGKEISPLEAFFHLFPRKELARDLFHVLEGARVDHCLQREYRGLKKDMGLFFPIAIKSRPAIFSLPFQQAFLESILRWEVLGEPISPPFLALLSQGDDLSPHLMALTRPGAGVKESARAAVLLYRKLSRIPNLKPALTWEAEALPSLTLPLSAMGGIDPASRLVPGEEPYQNPAPPPHWGELRPELVQKKLRLREVQNLLNRMETGTVFGPKDTALRGGAVSFWYRDVHPHDLATILNEDGVAIRAGHHCAQLVMRRYGTAAAARASFYVYNTAEEIDVLVDALEKAGDIFTF